MKQSDITSGILYTNGVEGHGQRIRLVLAEGSEYLLYRGQADHDCLRYSPWRRNKKGVLVAEDDANSTRSSFASWAKRFATQTETAEVRAAILARSTPAKA